MIDFGRPIKRIVLHCTASSLSATKQQILDYWRNELGWRYPGYHYLIDQYGNRHILSHLSKPTNGVKGYNWNSVHISYIGGKGGIDNRTDAQKREMENLLLELCSDKILGPKQILGHRDLSPDRDGDGIIEPHEWTKLCPSFDVAEWLEEIQFHKKLQQQ